jgi:Protein of unknown function (DUF3102)
MTHRPLEVIAAEIRASKAETIVDIIAMGGLLLEAKDQLDHGQWLPWLQLQQFGYSARTAQNYIRAHKFAGQHKNVADIKLTPTALYRLVDTSRRHRGRLIYTPEAIVAILAAAKDKRVGPARADAIAVTSRHQLQGEGTPAAGHQPDADPHPTPIQLAATLQPASLGRDAALRENSRLQLQSWRHLPQSRAKSLLASSRLIAWKWSPTS